MAHQALDGTPSIRYGARMRRWLHTGVALAIPLTLTGAAQIVPNPAGFGTHEVFGLPPCLFKTVVGIPCPSCGLTTSFVQLLHGQIGTAWHANPAGFPFLAGLIAIGCVSIYGAIHPFSWRMLIARSWFHRVILYGIGWQMGWWVVRLVHH